jgi:hypothetical protein
MGFICLSADRSSLKLEPERDHAANGGGPDESIMAAGLVGPAVDDNDGIKVGLGGRRLRSWPAWFKGRRIRGELREERCGGNGGGGSGGTAGMEKEQEQRGTREGGKVGWTENCGRERAIEAA